MKYVVEGGNLLSRSHAYSWRCTSLESRRLKSSFIMDSDLVMIPLGSVVL